jgi:hypothetical protein
MGCKKIAKQEPRLFAWERTDQFNALCTPLINGLGLILLNAQFYVSVRQRGFYPFGFITVLRHTVGWTNQFNVAG